MMKKILVVFFVLLLGTAQAAHKAYGKSGTATTTNAVITFPFNPSSICVSNTGTTNNLYFDYTDGIAVAADDSTNHLVPPGATLCLAWNDPNVVNEFLVGVITSASTTTYNINGTQR